MGQQPDFLSITLLNGAAGRQSVVLELVVSQVEPSSGRLFRGETDPFVLEGAARRLTNRDLASRGRDVSIQTYEIGSRADELTDRISETGRFPAGTYRFSVRVRTLGLGAELEGFEPTGRIVVDGRPGWRRSGCARRSTRRPDRRACLRKWARGGSERGGRTGGRLRRADPDSPQRSTRGGPEHPGRGRLSAKSGRTRGDHYEVRRRRPYLEDAWLEQAIEDPEFTQVQANGRVRHWIFIEALGKHLRVVTLPDGETIHTAFPDRGFDPEGPELS